ncbi:MAG: indolepyruvate ferredoxin oxidoreductase subunit alpha [Candidatus Methanomethylophilaceae archaeon]|jgi:indolepyruvate ferredoxin oxidoreductase alpha subunit
MTDILAKDGKHLLLGNEAITRGLFEAGVRYSSTYPGTPSSEVGNILETEAEKGGMYFEFSTNEKTALEVAAAAAASGLRSFTFMKHVGLNVAADPMMTLAYSGVEGGMLIMTADDPSCHSSQNEQDNRMYAMLSLLPMVEPSTPAEAKDMIAEAYKISEAVNLPVIYRTTTRVNHARGPVEFGPMADTPVKGHFVKDDPKYVNIPAFSKPNRTRLLEKQKKAMELSENSPLNFTEGEGEVGIITSGVSYTYVKEFVGDAAILKLGFTAPLPEKKIADFVRGKKAVIIVEELEPYLEDNVLRISAQESLSVPIYGKRSGHFPREWEYSPDTLTAVSDIVKVQKFEKPLSKPDILLPGRPPTLCAGCPHRGTFAAVTREMKGKEAVYCSDIGCYTLGIQAPFHAADFIICMGGGAGAAGGFAEATDQIPIAFIGDSTFFHSGVQPLVSALFNNHKIKMIIMDNRSTAMTGHQPNPGTGRNFGGITTEPLDIESLVKGIGVKHVSTVDPYDVKAMRKAVREAIDFDGVAVVVAKQACPLELKKQKILKVKRCEVDHEKCIRCYTCLKTIACPALIKDKDGSILVDDVQCIGCGMCANVCPKDALEVKE